MKGLIFSFILPAILLAASHTNLTAQCLEGNCRNGYGVFRFTNGDKYAGNWVSGQPHGKGKYYFNTKERYEGEFRYVLGQQTETQRQTLQQGRRHRLAQL